MNEQNLVTSTEPRDFFVWVNPRDFLVQHNASVVGSFTGGPIVEAPGGPAGLLFIENPNPPQISVSPFHSGVVNWYRIEYNLENHRNFEFQGYPSRFHALFLLQDRAEAQHYHDTHKEHLKGRILKRVQSFGQYAFSIHDASWIDFLREPHMMMDDETIAAGNRAYWSGKQTKDCSLMLRGQPWRGSSVMEVLFYGRVDFLNREMTLD
jgi:hypothetical protein